MAVLDLAIPLEVFSFLYLLVIDDDDFLNPSYTVEFVFEIFFLCPNAQPEATEDV